MAKPGKVHIRLLSKDEGERIQRMNDPAQNIQVYLEIGKKRTFAGAIDWPGWSRSSRDEESALGSLVSYGPRYTRALERVGLQFPMPSDSAAFDVTERLSGNTATDFGVPEMAPLADSRPIDDRELQRLSTLLMAFWKEFDGMVQAATGKELRRGPRGGGRDLDKIVEHVTGGEKFYLSRIAWKMDNPALLPAEDLQRTHRACLDALEHAVHHGLPERGPRGSAYWSPRYFVRRVAWHVLDHAWEIEDRII